MQKCEDCKNRLRLLYIRDKRGVFIDSGRATCGCQTFVKLLNNKYIDENEFRARFWRNYLDTLGADATARESIINQVKEYTVKVLLGEKQVRTNES